MDNFIHSIAYHSVSSCTKSQLLNRRKYPVMAIAYWKGKDLKESKFFEDELILIDERLKQIN